MIKFEFELECWVHFFFDRDISYSEKLETWVTWYNSKRYKFLFFL